MTDRRLKLRRTEHELISGQLSLYLDDRLDADQVVRLEAHVRTCETCREDLRTLRWTRDLLRETPMVRLPRSFVIREADLTPQPATRRRRPLFAMQWATAVVGLLFVLVLAGDLLTGRWMRAPGAQPEMLAVYQDATGEAMVVEAEKAVVAQSEAAGDEEGEKIVLESEAPRKLGMPTEDAPKAAAPEAIPPRPEQNDAEVATTVTPAPVAAGRSPADADRTPGVAQLLESAEKESVVAPAAEATPAAPAAVSPTSAPMEMAAAPTTASSPEAAAVEEAPKLLPPTSLVPEPGGGAERPQLPAEEGSRVGRGLRSPLSAWRAVEIGLGVVLVGLLAAVIWTRRRL